MKKIFSLFCAMAIVLSAVAAPKVALTGIEKKQTVEQVRKAPAFMSEKGIVKHAAKAPQAKQATTNVTVSAVASKFYESDNDIYYSLYNEDKTVIFCFDIVCAEGEQDVVSGQTYTLDDMLADYCEWVPANDVYNGTAFTAATFKKTTGENGAYTIEATATDANGDEFILTYIKEAPVVYDEPIVIVIAEGVKFNDQTATAGWWQIWGANDDYSVSLSNGNTVTEATGTYTIADLDPDYSYVQNRTNGDKIGFTAGTVSLKTSKSGSVTAEGSLTGSDGNTYNIKLSFAPKAPVSLTLTSCETKQYSTDIEYHLSNAAGDTLFVFDIKKTSGQSDIELGKTYTLSDMYSSYSYAKFNNGSKVSYSSASFTKTQDEAGLVHIEASASDAAGNTWNIVYQEKPFVPTGEVIELSIEDPMAIPQYYNDGSWELYYKSVSSDTVVAFVYYSENATSPAGTFTEEDFLLNYCGIVLDGENMIEIHSAELTVTDTDARIDVEATVFGSNGIQYNITMFYSKPVTASQETITSNELEINTNNYDWYGVIKFTASDENNAIELTVNANGKGAQMAGEYVAGTSFNGTVTPTGGEKTEIYSGTITIAVAENGDVTLTGVVLGSNSVEYTLNLKFIKPEPTTTNLTMTTASASPSNGYISYTLSNADYFFFFRIYLTDGQEDVVSGTTYTFADNMGGSTWYSYGLVNDGSYTFIDYAAATFVKNVSATELRIDAAIEDIDGNFWNLTYTEKLEPTAVDNVNAEVKAVKRIENGQLIIRMNGKDFNAQGAVIR